MNNLEAVHEALLAMKEEGIDHVFVHQDTLQALASVSADPTDQQPDGSRKSKPKQTEGLSDVSEQGDQGNRASVQKKPGLPAPPVIVLPEGEKSSQMKWLEEKVHHCETCGKHLSANGKIVFGRGAVNADIFFCGEAPGSDEEAKGEPFAGEAGQLLTKIIQAMGLTRDDVYIANILKWRPEHDKPYGNRPPTVEEMEFCLPYLEAQIKIVQPKVIVALGNTAVAGLLGPDPNRRLGEIRGSWQRFQETEVMVTFHPSYLLRNNTLKTKRLAWEDMLKVMERVQLPISEKQKTFFLPKP